MRWAPLIVSLLLAVVAVAGLFGGLTLPVPSWLLWVVAVPAGAVALNELLGKPVPFLRWSFLRMLFGMSTLLKNLAGGGWARAARRRVRAGEGSAGER